jgi:hypothetical protein
MKSVHQLIYETLDLPEEEALSIVGGATIRDKRERMQEFLRNNKWDEAAFKLWIRNEWNPIRSKPLPHKAEMARNVAQAGKQALLTGFKKVSDEEQKQRHTICKTDCEWYRQEDDRCAKCGCFTSFKSRLEAWHCPIDKW